MAKKMTQGQKVKMQLAKKQHLINSCLGNINRCLDIMSNIVLCISKRASDIGDKTLVDIVRKSFHRTEMALFSMDVLSLLLKGEPVDDDDAADAADTDAADEADEADAADDTDAKDAGDANDAGGVKVD